MKCEQAQVVKIVADFACRTRGADPKAVKADTPLFREGLVDSFGLVELIAELETGLNVVLPEGSLIPEDFETPQVLWERLQQL